jgi:rod shape determining protein RodA
LNKPWWHRIDFSLILTTVTLIFIGLVMISSASGNHFSSPEVRRQFTYFIIGFLLLVLFTAIDYEFWGRTYKYIFALNIVLLTAVMIFGHTVKGAQRWVSLGPLGTFQPSETAKLATIITLAKILTMNEAWKIRDILKAGLYVAIPWLLILIQPDLGTALVLIAVSLALFYMAGVKPWILFSTMLAGLLAAPFVLKDYQKRRLLTFINPEGDPEGSGWNLIQAKIAIGSGKIWGKGIFLGTQNQLNFVPEHSTDFIFTVIGEELGMVGAAGILLLYFYLLWQGLSIARSSRDSFGTLLAVGIVAMLGFHIMVNIGMTLGIMPVAGIPLPFISYGGSSLLTNMMAIGILGSIYFRRRKIF